MKIYYFTPYSTEKNIGKAYNESCALVPNDEDWIVIRDGDTMFLTPDWGRTIENVLRKHGDVYALFGAMTNRVGEYHHKIAGMFDQMDIRKHHEVAEQWEKIYGEHVLGTAFDIAGFFMAFQKKTWKGIGGFDENTAVFDRIFTRKVRKAGGKVGLMEGVYLLHSYRIWSEDPAGDTSHLFPQDLSKK